MIEFCIAVLFLTAVTNSFQRVARFHKRNPYVMYNIHIMWDDIAKEGCINIVLVNWKVKRFSNRIHIIRLTSNTATALWQSSVYYTS